MNKVIKKITWSGVALWVGLSSCIPVYGSSLRERFSSVFSSHVSSVNQEENENFKKAAKKSQKKAKNQHELRNYGWVHTMFGDNIDVQPLVQSGTHFFNGLLHAMTHYFKFDISKPYKDWTDEDKVRFESGLQNLNFPEVWDKHIKPELKEWESNMKTTLQSARWTMYSIMGVAGLSSIYIVVSLVDRFKKSKKGIKKTSKEAVNWYRYRRGLGYEPAPGRRGRVSPVIYYD